MRCGASGKRRGLAAAAMLSLAAAASPCLAQQPPSERAVTAPADDEAVERGLRDAVETAAQVGDVRAQSRAARALADHLALTGRADRGAALLADMAVIDAQALGAGDRDHLITEYRLAELWLATGRNAQALARIETAGQGAERALGADDPLTLRLKALWAVAFLKTHPDDGTGGFLDATDAVGGAYETAKAAHSDDPALMFDILSAYAEVLLMLEHTSMALPAVQDMVELMDQELAGDPGQRRRMRARLGMMVLEERFVRDALIILRQASQEVIAARDTRSAQAELRQAAPFRAMVEGAWIRSFDREFGLANDANLNRYDPAAMGDFSTD